MSTVLIDERGKVWDPQSLGLRIRLRASIDHHELRAFAVLNLGFIALDLAQHRAQVRLRPRLVSPAALGTLYLWLHRSAPRRLALTWYDGQWHNELVGWHHAGWRRLTQLLERSEGGRHSYSRGRISPERLARGNPLRRVLEDAPSLSALVANPATLLPPALSDRYLLLAEDGDRELRVRDVGTALMLRSPQWRRRARGRRLDDLPDWHYGQWVADAYREAGRGSEPLLEEVAAVIEWPGLGTLSHSYWRLIVPASAPGGGTRLLGVTLDNPGVGIAQAG